MQYLQGVTFPHQSLTPKEWGALFENVVNDGILKGCAVTASGANVYISPGVLVVKGRLIRVSGTVTEETTPTYSDGYGRIKVCINTSNESTESINHQVFIVTEYSSSETFPNLTQDDINDSGTLYEVELARFQYVSGSISTVTEKLPIVDSKQKQITYGTADPTGGSIGDIYIKYTE